MYICICNGVEIIIITINNIKRADDVRHTTGSNETETNARNPILYRGDPAARAHEP